MLEPDASIMFRLEIGATKHNDLDESRAGHYAPLGPHHFQIVAAYALPGNTLPPPRVPRRYHQRRS